MSSLPETPTWGPHDTAPWRTRLAWQRTGLALVVASMVLLRVTMETLGLLAPIACGIAVLTSGWVVLETLPGRAPSGPRRALLLTFSVAVLALTELVAVVGRG